VIKIGKWISVYGEEQAFVLSPKGNDIAGDTSQLVEARDTLGPDAQSRLGNAFLQSTNIILQAAQRNEVLAQLPIGIPMLSQSGFGGRKRLTDWPMQQV
jgi:hypothetical protein